MRYMYGPDLLARISRIDEYNLIFFGANFGRVQECPGGFSQKETPPNLSVFFNNNIQLFAPKLEGALLLERLLSYAFVLQMLKGHKVVS